VTSYHIEFARLYEFALKRMNAHFLLTSSKPDRPYSFYDLTKDAEVLTRGMDISDKIVFSQIAHWVPPKKD
jgi:hypothetical protein